MSNPPTVHREIEGIPSAILKDMEQGIDMGTAETNGEMAWMLMGVTLILTTVDGIQKDT